MEFVYKILIYFKAPFENIRYGRLDATDEEVVEAAENGERTFIYYEASKPI